MGGSWVRSRWCFKWRDLASAGVRSRRCWGATRPVQSGVRCGGAIWGCVHNLVGSTFSSCSWFGSFFFENGLKVSLKMGFGQWGDTIWAGRSLVKVSLDMSFGQCEE